MARIKGKWVGQVVIEYDGITKLDPEKDLEKCKKQVEQNVCDGVYDCNESTHFFGGVRFVTVTQLHADLYRDEPSEWTKEEATP